MELDEDASVIYGLEFNVGLSTILIDMYKSSTSCKPRIGLPIKSSVGLQLSLGFGYN